MAAASISTERPVAFARHAQSRTNANGPVTAAIAAMQGSVDRTTPLSTLFRCPVLRAAFRRAERDGGETFAVPAPKPSTLNGGAVAVPVRDLVLA